MPDGGLGLIRPTTDLQKGNPGSPFHPPFRCCFLSGIALA
ncbi:hypothetical protein HMPREF0208_04086 [Citrobacter koseri]|nr:hypothetical protein HMPREF0208_04086 [Citrobacter koseri]